ncbi:MAG: ferredoxin family protein [Deltaproteobacteria bacterium]|nr:ferredoxin family protein [Deltaproteobacteria bacterium]
MTENAYLIANNNSVGLPITIDPELCSGCNSCVAACRAHLLFPNPEKGKPPMLFYSEECWGCGCCVEYCTVPGAIKMRDVLHQRVGWKRKETGEYYRIGMKTPPSPNTRPPVY